MSGFDYQADDKNKVVPIERGKDGYTPQPDDIPYEAWEEYKTSSNLKLRAQSGISNRLHLPALIEIPVENEKGKRLPKELYRLVLPSGKVLLGETDDQGMLKVRIEEKGQLAIRMENNAPVTIEIE